MNLKEHKMSTLYKDHSVNEEATDSTYSIHLLKANHSVDYKFTLQKVDWVEEPVLTYSIMENEFYNFKPTT
jgi:hypothetical protein